MRVPSAGTQQAGAAGTALPAPCRGTRMGWGRGSASREVEPCLQSPTSDPSPGRKGRRSSLGTPWIHLEACFAHKITAERAAGTTLDAAPHIPAELCSCGDKSWHISGRCQQLWEGDHRRGGESLGCRDLEPLPPGVRLRAHLPPAAPRAALGILVGKLGFSCTLPGMQHLKPRLSWLTPCSAHTGKSPPWRLPDLL